MSRSTQTNARRLATLPGAALIAALITSCGGGSDAVTGSGNPNNTVASVSLSDSAITVEMGFLRQLSATAKSSTGATLPVAIVWTSDNPAVAQIIDGNVTAVSVGTAHITATAGGKSASAAVTVIPTIVISVQLSRTKMTLPPGRIVQLTATPLDASGRPIAGRAVTFKSSDNSIVSAGQTGLLTPIAEGSATITASSDGKSSVDSVLVARPTQISILAIASRPEGFPQPHTFSITMRDDDDSLAATSSDGSPATLSGQMLLSDSVQFVARADAAIFFTSRLTATRGAMPASVPVVLIPRNIIFTTGPFAGSSIEPSMDAATAPCSKTFGAQCANGFYGGAFRSGVKVWQSLPIPVLLSTAFSSADSTALWDSLHALEDALGRKVFTLADSQSPHRIAVVLGDRPADAPPGSAGLTIWSWDEQGRITNAQIWFASSTPSRSLIHHEFLHALGFWHTCSWPSVMGGYGCNMVALTAADAAYVNLAYAVFNSETALRLPNGNLPCGAMGVWNATILSQPAVFCDGDNPAPPDARLIPLGTRMILVDDSLHRRAIAQ